MSSLLGIDTLELARAQFGFAVALHIVFPAFSIGLSSYFAVLEGLWFATGREEFLNLFRYWLKIFAIAFAMGVVSGIVMSYQFGTNWAVFSDKTGPVLGPLMAYEVLSAFFLEAGFLGVMLFGMNKVGKALHFVATLAVAFGTLFSAFWILSVNSWMQTPAGYGINPGGQFVPADWWSIVFNPSFPYRLVHMVLAAYLTTALVVGATAAWHLVRSRSNEEVRIMFSMAMWMFAIVAPIQIVAGDLHGLNTLEHQPAKVMAMEGHFHSHPDGAPLLLFGVPDQAAGKVDYAVEIPKLSSLILKHDLDAPLTGLDTVPRKDWPPVPVVFWSFRVMVGLGFLMLGLGAASLFARWRGALYTSRWLHWFALAMGPAGFVAVLAGWITTEVGRQPFTVYGLLRTAESASPLQASAVGASLLSFVLAVNLILGGAVQQLILAATAIAAQCYFVLLSYRIYTSNLAALEARAEKDALFGELEQAKVKSDDARQRAEAANIAKSRFLAQMSHELRTPLNAILGFSEIMKNEVLGRHNIPVYKEYAADIHNSGVHLLGLINEILDLSRIEAGRYELNETMLGLAQTVEECHRLLKLRARNRGIIVYEFFEPNMPKLWADERAVRQVCLNLLSNGIKFTPKGGKIWLKVGWTNAGGQYLSVRDTGPGIPEEEIPVVLDPFGQGSNAIKSAEQGAGLGLPIVKSIIDLHGGTFRLNSKVGEGTEVIVTFPPERVIPAAEPAGEAAAKKTDAVPLPAPAAA